MLTIQWSLYTENVQYESSTHRHVCAKFSHVWDIARTQKTQTVPAAFDLMSGNRGSGRPHTYPPSNFPKPSVVYCDYRVPACHLLSSPLPWWLYHPIVAPPNPGMIMIVLIIPLKLGEPQGTSWEWIAVRFLYRQRMTPPFIRGALGTDSTSKAREKPCCWYYPPTTHYLTPLPLLLIWCCYPSTIQWPHDCWCIIMEG